MIISGPDFVSFRMGELPFDGIAAEPLFIEDRACRGTNTVRSEGPAVPPFFGT